MADDSLSKLVLGTGDLSWLRDAQCGVEEMDESDFFVRAGHTIKPDVVRVCKECPVRLECVDHAYQSDPPMLTSGYYAGMSPGERKRFDRDEAIAHAVADSAQHYDNNPDLKRPAWAVTSAN